MVMVAGISRRVVVFVSQDTPVPFVSTNVIQSQTVITMAYVAAMVIASVMKDMLDSSVSMNVIHRPRVVVMASALFVAHVNVIHVTRVLIAQICAAAMEYALLTNVFVTIAHLVHTVVPSVILMAPAYLGNVAVMNLGEVVTVQLLDVQETRKTVVVMGCAMLLPTLVYVTQDGKVRIISFLLLHNKTLSKCIL